MNTFTKYFLICSLIDPPALPWISGAVLNSSRNRCHPSHQSYQSCKNFHGIEMCLGLREPGMKVLDG